MTTETLYYLARPFRGCTLYLRAHESKSNLFYWTTDRTRALTLTAAQALRLSDIAAKEYGAATCDGVRVDGNGAVRSGGRPEQFASRAEQRRAASLRGIEAARNAQRPRTINKE